MWPAGAAGGWRGRDPHLEVGFPWLFTLHPFLSLSLFFLFSRLSHRLLLSPGLVAGKGKVGWKRGGVGMRLHILLLASETCSVLCAESGVGRFGSSSLGGSGWGERQVRAFGKDLRV